MAAAPRIDSDSVQIKQSSGRFDLANFYPRDPPVAEKFAEFLNPPPAATHPLILARFQPSVGDHPLGSSENDRADVFSGGPERSTILGVQDRYEAAHRSETIVP